jgi:hypothetical protein
MKDRSLIFVPKKGAAWWSIGVKKFPLLWVISIALILEAGINFGEARRTGGMHGHEGYDHGPGVGERGRGERVTGG